MEDGIGIDKKIIISSSCILEDIHRDLKKNLNNEEIIHDFLFIAYLVYLVGRVCTFVGKHHGFSDPPTQMASTYPFH